MHTQKYAYMHIHAESKCFCAVINMQKLVGGGFPRSGSRLLATWIKKEIDYNCSHCIVAMHNKSYYSKKKNPPDVCLSHRPLSGQLTTWLIQSRPSMDLFLFLRCGDTLWLLLVVLQQESRNKHLLWTDEMAYLEANDSELYLEMLLIVLQSDSFSLTMSVEIVSHWIYYWKHPVYLPLANHVYRIKNSCFDTLEFSCWFECRECEAVVVYSFQVLFIFKQYTAG